MISVLFVSKNSIYKTMTDSKGQPLDCWDEDRNALLWPGGNPIVAHPPCRLFCKLRLFSTAPESEKRLAYWAVEQVRKEGGVLEHPAYSRLWQDCALPRPGKRDQYGFTFGIDQFWWGHPARKRTWLYICGTSANRLPEVPMRMGHTELIFYDRRVREGIRKQVPGSRHIRSATPPEFAQWLIETAEGCQRVTTAMKDV